MFTPISPAAAEWRRNGYLLSFAPELLDVDWVHEQLALHSYWAKGQPREMTLRSLAGSLPFGLYAQRQQVGFGRLITDYTRFAYLIDVIIARPHRGQGLGGWLAAAVTQHPELQTVKRWLLATADAHEVYRRAGWQPVSQPERLMEFMPMPPTEERLS
ncbi:acetyltransferase (GNAT) family protein [Gibbsiella quercinecans]|uniref:GNAT family acetyltransferase n=1 Tax=Gibbsiella quercinecans TaxID=929813 RepID=A0A250AX42_9GAMM|nr:GNAT family N-acetyltransferase [Gibbsiella quercinecans]ATA18543.1 GNAT family acetyltransferase [Gibbsiella quercinecans]RLM04337.1 GNAT family N-acetyltransferase [Gibbsiella quercinecans]RLM07243.1 GNAT family N-acetyltransferase [Gibbsiella quercinecans]TCT82399.1 acetyltransferase (GNAT) family protein [Gibbsiella quercinecans]